jgi:hypothetical protein
LPAGEKVLFNGKWINIENVKIGDVNNYGTVINTTQHNAEKIIEITVKGVKVKATWNHPFLIKREKKIYWMNAENIKKGDFVLTNYRASAYNTQKPFEDIVCRKNTKKQIKDISDIQKIVPENLGFYIVSYGKIIMVKFLSECKYIIKILTKKTIVFPIYNLSRPLSIKGITQVVDLSKAYGLNHVKFVTNLKNVIKRIGIIPEDGLTGKYVKNVSLKSHLIKERFLCQKVGNVKIIKQKTKVYNLTINGIPAFETKIGLSHNTQKSINILCKLINIFTDPGDIIIDPVAGSGSTLIAALETGRSAYGFEINKKFYESALNWIDEYKSQGRLFDAK